MSWQAYIDTSLVGTGHIDEAAIFSKDGNDDWAHSSSFKISPDEMKIIVQAFTSPDTVLANGFKVNGNKYMTISTPNSDVNPDVLIGKKGKEGFIVTKTVQALILAHHPDGVATPACLQVVENLATYLKGLQY